MAAPVTNPGDQDIIRDRQNRLLQEQRQRLEELKALPGSPSMPDAPAMPADSRCFAIDTINIEGAQHLPAGARSRLLKPYLGQCLDVARLNELLKVITEYYLSSGLVTSRAYLPQQDLSSGHLRVLVVEGTLEGLDRAEGSGLSARELAMAFPGADGELLNLRQIEQLVDQLNRLPSNQARMELAPGANVGGTRVKVENTAQKPWRASVSRNNDGQKSTGEQQWGTALEWDSPLGLADQLVLRGGHDAVSDRRKTSQNAMLYYSLPWGWWNFSYSYSQSDYRSQVQGNGFNFKQSGDSQHHLLRAERVIHRDDLSKTSMNLGVAHLRTNAYIEDSRLDLSSNRLSELQWGINHGRRVASAFINFDLGLQHGIGAFDAQSAGHPGPGEPEARFRKYTATASYLQPFTLAGESLSFTSLVTGQHTDDVLFSAQRISLGGASSLRGFKDQQLSGDSGAYWRNDLRWARPLTVAWLRPALAEYGASLGYDQGVITHDRYNGDQHGRLSSHSLELFARGQHLSAGVTFAHSLKRPAAMTEREAPIYFRLDFFL